MMKKFFLMIAAIVVALGVGMALYFSMPVAIKHNLKLPSSKPAKITAYLKKEGIGVNYLDELFLSFVPTLQKGWVYFNETKLPRYKFLTLLGRKSIHYTPVTIIPGETTYFVLDMLAKKLHMNRDKLQKSYERLRVYTEGNFLANTYNIPVYFDERGVVKFLIDRSFQKFRTLSLEYFNTYKTKDWKKVVTVASIVQKEAANKAEMPIVASVIFNRLKKKMRLQMDGTLNYGQYSHTPVTPARIKGDKSFYNTYKLRGLPKEPVCNVSIYALKAALNPAKTEYLYFMKNSRGEHNFSKEYKTHIKNIQKRRLEGASKSKK